uniref:uncharacterized protein LOC109951779 n=1 Tax=Monopterus albus TaxID=43700 RepID=UPI0009B3A552|nr:uncharacterized protein LOC109951779 [Monopterus albus]
MSFRKVHFCWLTCVIPDLSPCLPCSQLREEVRQAKCLITQRSDLQAQLEEAEGRALHLEGQLVERGAECRELASLRRELENLRGLSQSQEQRVAQSHRDAQQCQVELASLEAILALLHLREGTVGPLCARPCTLPPVDYSGTAHLLKLKPGEGYQQLLRVLQSAEAERAKQNSLVERLQERLSRAQEEISSLQSSMAQRASHYQSLHMELLDKVSQATNTEKEGASFFFTTYIVCHLTSDPGLLLQRSSCYHGPSCPRPTIRLGRNRCTEFYFCLMGEQMSMVAVAFTALEWQVKAGQ